MRQYRRLAITLAVTLLVAEAAGAHHSFAVFFDTDAKLVVVTGVAPSGTLEKPTSA